MAPAPVTKAKRKPVPSDLEMRRDVWRFMSRSTHRFMHFFEQEMKKQGGDLTWFDVLGRLQVHPEGKLRLQSLADAVLFSQSGLSRLVDRLEKSGYVEREPCEDDRRGCYVIITERGSEYYEHVRETFWSVAQQHFGSHFTNEEVEALLLPLRKMDALAERVRIQTGSF